MTQDECLIPCLSSLRRLPKGKWNSSNGVEEKETWVEEDELFDVQGKLGDSPWFLFDTCKCKMHVTITSVFQKLLVSQLKKFQQVPHCD